MISDYGAFLNSKTKSSLDFGFEPVYVHDSLFDFQKRIVEWSIRKGRAAIFADCGLGKTAMQLVWADNICRKTNGKVLILTPLSVAFQTVKEGSKFGIEVINRKEGIQQTDKIVVTNYERLHNFNSHDFTGIVCDESSILKNFDGETRKQVTDFMSTIKYRLLCTATAAPNDYVELGTSSEALGIMDRRHMLAQFFTHDGGDTATWRLKGHAREHLFWRWICSWAIACRKPSDVGYDDGPFKLPKLITNSHVVNASKPIDGYLFDLPAVGLDEQRADLRRTLNERCEMAAKLCNAIESPAVCWTNLNAEADLIARETKGSVNVQGSDSDDKKEESFKAFVDGQIRVMVSKPSIAGFGLNWQHCANMTFFPSHSYEQFYQCVRRCWRFGQKRDVIVDMITTNGQENVLRNMERKSVQADRMFDQLVTFINNETKIVKQAGYTKKEEVPSWL